MPRYNIQVHGGASAAGENFLWLIPLAVFRVECGKIRRLCI